MADNLYPVYDVPSMNTVDPEEKRKYSPSLYFDYELGDFRLDGRSNIVIAEGQEAYKQWCIKTILTERFACLAYSDCIGTEMALVAAQPDYDAQCSDIERQYTEALMANPKTQYVRDFQFSQPHPDSIAVSFVVKGREYDEESIYITIRK